MKQNLKDAGLKVTLPRLAVLKILADSEQRHMSVEEVYQALLAAGERVGLATVYRVLTQLGDAGIVEQHDFNDGHAVFELAGEEHHDHMIDLDTGQIIEFSNEIIESLQHEVAAAHGMELVDHELVLYVRKPRH
ncbi:MAG: ferric iron uptake transcriptional regulator [Pseudomonadota bacterium]